MRPLSITEFAREELRLNLSPGQAETLETFASGGYVQACWRMGRRSGKSLMADLLVLYDALVRQWLQARVRPGEPRIAAICAPTLDQSMAHISSCRSLIAHGRPSLGASLVNGDRKDMLEFVGGAQIRAFAASARGFRGYGCSSVVLDEYAHFNQLDASNSADAAVWEAAVPSTAQFDREGWIVASSTPLWRTGTFYTLCQRGEGGQYEELNYRHATTREMAPQEGPGAVSDVWLEARRREDPDLFHREHLAQFLDGAASFLPVADVERAVRAGRDRLRPQLGTRYVAAIDPGYQIDNFALTIAHRDGDGRVIVDGCWVWFRQGHERVLDAVAGLADEYRIRTLDTDQHAAAPVLEGLQRRGLIGRKIAWTQERKFDRFTTLKVLLATDALELPDDPKLTAELLALEARPTPNGGTRIAAARSAHDDRCTALAAAVDQLAGRHHASPEAVRGLAELNAGLRTRSGLGGLGLVGGRLPV